MVWIMFISTQSQMTNAYQGMFDLVLCPLKPTLPWATVAPGPHALFELVCAHVRGKAWEVRRPPNRRLGSLAA